MTRWARVLVTGIAAVVAHGIAFALPPTCSIVAAPARAVVGEMVAFDSQAAAPGGAVVSVAWDFGDGDTATGMTVSHVFLAPKCHAVTATVVDDQGASARCVAWVEMLPADRATVCHELSTSGWHLIALPLTPSDPDPCRLFAASGIDPSGRLFRYHPATGGYIGLYPGDPLGFGPMDKHHGYWLYLEQPCRLCYGGYRLSVPLERESWPLSGDGATSGWALTGTGRETPVSLDREAFLAYNQGVEWQWFWPTAWRELLGSPPYGWDAATRGYYCVLPLPADACDRAELEPWQGYWIHAQRPDLQFGVASVYVEARAQLQGVSPGRMACTLRVIARVYVPDPRPTSWSVRLSENGVGLLPLSQDEGSVWGKERTHLARRASWSSGLAGPLPDVIDPCSAWWRVADFGVLLAGDLNDDNTVSQADLDYLQAHWLSDDETADINRDGIVNEADRALLTANLGKAGDPEY